MTVDALPDLPPASARQGVPGHDQAGERANAVRLLTLRTQGLTYEQIAEQTGYADASGARHALLRALARHEAENVSELRAIENMRLDADERTLRAIIADRASTPEQRMRAVDARTRLSARRARLNGLDAPVAVSLSPGVQAELESVLAEVEDLVLGEVSDVRDDPHPDGP
ncbi:hypothetical protein Pam4_72 [Pseudanabaena phage Pam4]|nr:hypothetical protein Pam4_72 [Pseudanabaena phage Pam4]